MHFKQSYIFNVVAGACFLLGPSLAFAVPQVIVDGTIFGVPRQNIEGNPVQIRGEDHGKASGSNLFFSFEKFNLPDVTDQAVFSCLNSGCQLSTGTPITNVITRINSTGTDGASIINGSISFGSNLSGVNLWMFNPQGIMIGAGASINVPGAFHVSNASQLNFSTESFGLEQDEQSNFSTISRLFSVNPIAFGFVTIDPDDTGPLLPVTPSGGVSLNGGQINTTDGSIEVTVSSVSTITAAGTTLNAGGSNATLMLNGGNLIVQEGTVTSLNSTGQLRIDGQMAGNSTSLSAEAGNATLSRTGGVSNLSSNANMTNNGYFDGNLVSSAGSLVNTDGDGITADITGNASAATTLDNEGVIRGTASAGSDLRNTHQINGNALAGGEVFNEEGAHIVGNATATGALNNFGVISGNARSGINLHNANGASILGNAIADNNLENFSSIGGSATAGADLSNLGQINGNAEAGGEVYNAEGANIAGNATATSFLNNFGVITGNARSGVNLFNGSGASILGNAIADNNLENNSSIGGSATAGADLSNLGQINGNAEAGGAITNEASANIAGNATATSFLNNYGVITGNARSGVDLFNGSGASILGNAIADNNIDNFATINGHAVAGGYVKNHSSSTISGNASAGSYLTNAVNSVISGSATAGTDLTNSGAILGNALAGNHLSNEGDIFRSASASLGNVDNSGTIAGDVSAGGNVNNYSLIEGNVLASQDVFNSGTIEPTNVGGQSIVRAGRDLTNSGSILMNGVGTAEISAGRDLNNLGDMTLTGQGSATLNAGSDFSNTGSIYVSGDGSAVVSAGNDFINTGTLERQGTGQTSLQVTRDFNNLGAITISGNGSASIVAGRNFYMYGGSINFEHTGNALMTVGNEFILDGDPYLSEGNIGYIRFDNSGTAALRVNGNLTIGSYGVGQILRTGSSLETFVVDPINPGTSLTVNNLGSMILDSRDNSAVMQVSAAQLISLTNGGIIQRSGTAGSGLQLYANQIQLAQSYIQSSGSIDIGKQSQPATVSFVGGGSYLVSSGNIGSNQVFYLLPANGPYGNVIGSTNGLMYLTPSNLQAIRSNPANVLLAGTSLSFDSDTASNIFMNPFAHIDSSTLPVVSSVIADNTAASSQVYDVNVSTKPHSQVALPVDTCGAGSSLHIHQSTGVIPNLADMSSFSVFPGRQPLQNVTSALDPLAIQLASRSVTHYGCGRG